MTVAILLRGATCMLLYTGVFLIFSLWCLTLSMISGEGLQIQTALSLLPSLGLMYKHWCSFICKMMRIIRNMGTNHVTFTYLLFWKCDSHSGLTGNGLITQEKDLFQIVCECVCMCVLIQVFMTLAVCLGSLQSLKISHCHMVVYGGSKADCTFLWSRSPAAQADMQPQIMTKSDFCIHSLYPSPDILCILMTILSINFKFGFIHKTCYPWF